MSIDEEIGTWIIEEEEEEEIWNKGTHLELSQKSS